MEQAAADWRYDEIHKAKPFHDGTFDSWSEKRSLSHPYHCRDGLNLWVSEADLTPHDHFLGGAEQCNECQEVASGNQT